MTSNRLRVKLLTNDATVPTRAYSSNGYDLYTCKEVTIAPMEVAPVNTGIAVEIPDGFVGIVKERSSYGKRGIAVRAGVIDQDYRGEVIVLLQNFTGDDVVIKKGDKIAQLLIVPTFLAEIEVVDELDETERGEKGFGSSG